MGWGGGDCGYELYKIRIDRQLPVVSILTAGQNEYLDNSGFCLNNYWESLPIGDTCKEQWTSREFRGKFNSAGIYEMWGLFNESEDGL